MHSVTAFRLAPAVAATAVVLAGFGSAADAQTPPGGQAPSFTTAPCPSQVTRAAVTTATCGYLTVPESRARPNGRTVRLFVVRERPSGVVRPDPVFVVWPLATARNWTAPDFMPARVHRERISMDPRGVGRSRPSLACPELERQARSSMAAPLNDPRTRAVLLRAVRSCRDRLVREGIDLGAYNVTESATDAEDLRQALGIESWNVAGYGNGSRVVLEILRRHPQHVRAAWLDSPEIPQVDFLTTGILGTRYMLEQVAKGCAADRACNARFPKVASVVARNLGAAERRPRVFRGRHGATKIPIAVDGGTLLRAIREGAAHVPQAVPLASALDNLRDPRLGYDWISDGPAFMLGYVSDPGREDVFDHGAFFSTVCRDQLPFVRQAALVSATRGVPAYREAFAESPFPAICGAWGAGRADASVRAPVSSSVPTLIVAGRFDPYAPLPLVRQAARTLHSSWVVEIPDRGNNPLGDSDCALSVRNAWIDNPASPPGTACVEALPALAFATG